MAWAGAIGCLQHASWIYSVSKWNSGVPVSDRYPRQNLQHAYNFSHSCYNFLLIGLSHTSGFERLRKRIVPLILNNLLRIDPKT